MEIRYAYDTSGMADRHNKGKGFYYHVLPCGTVVVLAHNKVDLAQRISSGKIQAEQITNWHWLGPIIASVVTQPNR